MNRSRTVSLSGMIAPTVVLIVLVISLSVAACAHRSHHSPFQPEQFSPLQEGRPGWPWGESGAGPLMHIAEQARDARYGWTPDQPIRLGGYSVGLAEAVEQQIRFLNSLWGPQGDVLLYEKVGTCCPFDWRGAPLDKGTLDVFELRGGGLPRPRHLYLDRYRRDSPRIPIGLTSRVPPPRTVFSDPAAEGGG
jgi:hypothetical protein